MLGSNFSEFEESILKKIFKECYDDEEYYENILSIQISIDFYIKFEDDLNKKLLFRVTKLPENLKSYIYNSHDFKDYEEDFLGHQVLSIDDLEDYIKKNKTRLDWELICERQNLSCKLMTEYKNFIDWNTISRYQYMDYKFLTENIDNIQWNLIPLNDKIVPVIDEGFLKLFEKTKIWDNIGYCDKITEEVIYKNLDKLNEKSWISISEHRELSKNDIMKLFI